MRDTPNLDRFLEMKGTWDEYTVLSDELARLERRVIEQGYEKLHLSKWGNQPCTSHIAFSESDVVNELALEAALNGLRVRKTELANTLRNSFHLEV